MSSIKRWESLAPELLSSIFSILPISDLLRSIPLVCTSWHAALADPCCWADIDIEDWCRRVNNTGKVDLAVQLLVGRGGGLHHRVNAYRAGCVGFERAVTSGKLLKVLQIIMCDVTDQMVVSHAPSLTNLTKLDISYCLNVSSKGIEVFGNNCKFLVYLRRNMPPPMVDPYTGEAGVEEGEAFAVANTMPRLEHLEFAYASFSDEGLDVILTKCKSLLDLNILGCLNVWMASDIANRCKKIQRFTNPWDNQLYGFYDDLFPHEVDDNSDEVAIEDVNLPDFDDDAGDVVWSDDEGDTDDVLKTDNGNDIDDVMNTDDGDDINNVMNTDDEDNIDDVLNTDGGDHIDDVLNTDDGDHVDDVLTADDGDDIDDVLNTDDGCDNHDVLNTDDEYIDDVLNTDDGDDIDDVLSTDDGYDIDDVMNTDDGDDIDVVMNTDDAYDIVDFLNTDDGDDIDDFLNTCDGYDIDDLLNTDDGDDIDDFRNTCDVDDIDDVLNTDDGDDIDDVLNTDDGDDIDDVLDSSDDSGGN